jgi:hypothetical protein
VCWNGISFGFKRVEIKNCKKRFDLMTSYYQGNNIKKNEVTYHHRRNDNTHTKFGRKIFKREIERLMHRLEEFDWRE